jgi:hypothetical protein
LAIHYIENWRLMNMNPTKNQGGTQVKQRCHQSLFY